VQKRELKVVVGNPLKEMPIYVPQDLITPRSRLMTLKNSSSKIFHEIYQNRKQKRVFGGRDLGDKILLHTMIATNSKDPKTL